MCLFQFKKKKNLHNPHIMKGYAAALKHFVWPLGWGSTGWRRLQRWGPWSRLSGRWPLTEPAAVLLHWPIPPGSPCCSPSCLSDWEPFIQYKKKDRLIRGRAERLPSVTAFAGIGRRPTHMLASGATSVSDSRMSATMPMISVATGGSTRLTLTTSQSFFTTDSSSESSSFPVPVSWPPTSSWIKSTTSAALSGGTEQVGSTVGWNHSTYQESGVSLDHFETLSLSMKKHKLAVISPVVMVILSMSGMFMMSHFVMLGGAQLVLSVSMFSLLQGDKSQGQKLCELNNISSRLRKTINNCQYGSSFGQRSKKIPWWWHGWVESYYFSPLEVMHRFLNIYQKNILQDVWSKLQNKNLCSQNAVQLGNLLLSCCRHGNILKRHQ